MFEIEIKEKIEVILSDKLGCDFDNLTEDSNLRDDFGADSLDMVEIIMELELEFQINISWQEGENLKTFKDLTDIVELKLNK